jgi:hypothetical protein
MDSPPAAASPAIDRRFLLGGIAGAAGVSALAAMARGGPLDPPAGPVISTGKTLTDAEPRIAVNSVNTPPSGSALFAITQRGSYYLTGNIQVPQSKVGVSLAPGVTLDLNGFSITGTGSFNSGVSCYESATVRNGYLNALAFGVSGQGGSNVVLEDLVVTGCTTRGITTGRRSTTRRCTVSGPSPVGIEIANDYGLLEDCVVTGAAVQGVYVNSYSTIRTSRFHDCAVGAFMGYGSRAERCAFDACSSAGLQAGARSFVSACTATGCGSGVELGDGAVLADSSCSANATGARAANAARIVNCSFDANTVAAIRLTGSGSCVESCHFTRNPIGVDMQGVGGNYIHKCVMLGNPDPLVVNIGGNWYPNIPLSGVNTATNPLASIIG